MPLQQWRLLKVPISLTSTSHFLPFCVSVFYKAIKEQNNNANIVVWNCESNRVKEGVSKKERVMQGFLKGWSRRDGVRYGGVLPAGCFLSAVICLCQRVNSHTRLSELSRAQLSALAHDRQQDSEMPVTSPIQHTHTLKRRATPDAKSRSEWNVHTYLIFWGKSLQNSMA